LSISAGQQENTVCLCAVLRHRHDCRCSNFTQKPEIGAYCFKFQQYGIDLETLSLQMFLSKDRRTIMSEINVAGKTVQLDNEGFLVNQEDWNHDVAQQIAKNEEIDTLDEEQLEIIEFLRNYYNKYHAFPILNYVCKHIGQKRECLNREFVNPMKAWKIAGLPPLDDVHFITFDGVHYQIEDPPG
jgi:tRNA 2-thiouridine synthesizing protein E